MAEGTVGLPAYVSSLEAVLRSACEGGEVRHELIRGERYRFEVVWSGFENMDHGDRQQLVWDAAESKLSRDEVRKVGMMLTVAPSEISAD